MNRFSFWRGIDAKLKLEQVDSVLGMEFQLDISKDAKEIESALRSIVEAHLPIRLKPLHTTNVIGTIGKYGMVQLAFEIEGDCQYPSLGGIKILRENGWFTQNEEGEFQGEGYSFLEGMLGEVEEAKNYLLVYAGVIDGTKNWFEKRSYLMQQILRAEPLQPREEDRMQRFRMMDMCKTNYSGIWLFKHFYL